MAEVNVKIKAQNQTRTGFQQALGDAQRFGTNASGSLKSSFAGVASDIKSSIGGALAGLASIGAIKSMIDQFGRIQDLSQQFGVSAESLQRFGQLASEGGSSVEQIAAAFSKLTINIQKAQSGTGAQADALRELGLSAKELSNLSPEQAFLRLADALEKGGGSNSSYAAALDLIGARQRDLIPLLAQGAEAISAQASAVDVASADTVAKVDAMGDSFSRLGQQISVGLGPAVALIGQVFLSAFAIVEAAVGKLASSMTSSFAAVGQVLGGNFKAAGEIMRGEADATAEQWSALQQKISQINSAPPKKKGKGALGAMDDAEESSSGSSANKKKAQNESNIRMQAGEQLLSNRRAKMSDEELLSDLNREEKFLSGDRGGSSETELNRLKVVAQIDQVEKQIADTKARADETANKVAQDASNKAQAAAEKKQNLSEGIKQEIADRQFSAMSPADQQAGLNEKLAAFGKQFASGSLTAEQAAQQAAQLIQMSDGMNGQQGFQGSSGASAFQRVGFATNEFFDTRKPKDPAAETAKAVSVLKKIQEILSKGEPLVLANTNS